MQGEGKGSLTTTGQLGDVMRESASIAHTFCRKFLTAKEPGNRCARMCMPGEGGEGELWERSKFGRGQSCSWGAAALGAPTCLPSSVANPRAL